jgi:transcription elongation factor GreA
MERVYLTQEGYDKLFRELEYLKNIKRKEISQALEHARLLGDLRENAEYASAKEALALNERRVKELEDKLSRAEIIDASRQPSDTIAIGVRVKLLDLNTNEELEYILVGPDESNPLEGFISITSPVGGALLGHKKDEVVQITIAAGILKYKIIEILRQ